MEAYRLQSFVELFNEYAKNNLDDPKVERDIECKLYLMLLSEDYYFDKQIDELSTFVDKYRHYISNEINNSETNSAIKKELRDMLTSNNNLEVAVRNIFGDLLID